MTDKADAQIRAHRSLMKLSKWGFSKTGMTTVKSQKVLNRNLEISEKSQFFISTNRFAKLAYILENEFVHFSRKIRIKNQLKIP